MKKFINSVGNVEKEMIEGMLKAYPDKMTELDCGAVLVRKNKKTNKVAVISGGGSGHEPSFAGYIGEGMLDAMIPAYEAIKQSAESGKSAKEALKAGVKAAWDGVEYTKTIAATKGRASYIGDRSIGHQDPGATSFAYILECIAEAV